MLDRDRATRDCPSSSLISRCADLKHSDDSEWGHAVGVGEAKEVIGLLFELRSPMPLDLVAPLPVVVFQ